MSTRSSPETPQCHWQLRAFAFVIALSTAGCLGAPQSVQDPILLSSWGALLGPQTDHVVIQTHYTEGHVPYAAALQTLKAELERVLYPKSIQLMDPVRIPPTGIANHTASDLVSLHEATFTLGNPMLGGDAASRTAWLHVLYVDGGMGGAAVDGETVGLHISALPAVYIFPDQLNFGAGLPEAAWTVLAANHEAIERAILIHEVGHAMGLVGCGTAMIVVHDDARHPCHSASSGSVMVSAVGGLQGMLELIQDNQWVPYRFDKDDFADLQAAMVRP